MYYNDPGLIMFRYDKESGVTELKTYYDKEQWCEKNQEFRIGTGYMSFDVGPWEWSKITYYTGFLPWKFPAYGGMKTVYYFPYIQNIGAEWFKDVSTLETVDVNYCWIWVHDSKYLVPSYKYSVLKSIDESAFENCVNLKEIKGLRWIPLTAIGDNAFKKCSSLTNLTFGDSLKRIGKYAFKDCTSLVQIDLDCDVPDTEENAFDGIDLNKLYIVVNGRYVRNYLRDKAWSKLKRYIWLDENQGVYYKYVTCDKIEFKNSGDFIFPENEFHHQLELNIYPADITDKVTWYSSNPDIIEVDDNGLITKKGVAGEAVITAKTEVGGIAASIREEVAASIKVKVPGETMEPDIEIENSIYNSQAYVNKEYPISVKVSTNDKIDSVYLTVNDNYLFDVDKIDDYNYKVITKNIGPAKLTVNLVVKNTTSSLIIKDSIFSYDIKFDIFDNLKGPVKFNESNITLDYEGTYNLILEGVDASTSVRWDYDPDKIDVSFTNNTPKKIDAGSTISGNYNNIILKNICAGSTTITATILGKYGNIIRKCYVNSLELKYQLNFRNNKYTVNQGDTLLIYADNYPSDLPVDWSTNDENLNITPKDDVNACEVTSNFPGEYSLMAELGDIRKNVQVTVNLVDSFIFKDPSITRQPGEKYTINFSDYPKVIKEKVKFYPSSPELKTSYFHTANIVDSVWISSEKTGVYQLLSNYFGQRSTMTVDVYNQESKNIDGAEVKLGDIKGSRMIYNVSVNEKLYFDTEGCLDVEYKQVTNTDPVEKGDVYELDSKNIDGKQVHIVTGRADGEIKVTITTPEKTITKWIYVKYIPAEKIEIDEDREVYTIKKGDTLKISTHMHIKPDNATYNNIIVKNIGADIIQCKKDEIYATDTGETTIRLLSEDKKISLTKTVIVKETLNTDIKAIAGNTQRAYRSKGNIIINTDKKETVKIYNLFGRLLYKANKAEGELIINWSNKDIVIVRGEGWAHKI